MRQQRDKRLPEPLKSIWKAMVARCTQPHHPSYANYGGRGIQVCDRWLDYSAFREDVGERPSSKHSLDRIDNDGDYEPSNCRWATSSEQNRNTRANRLIEHQGETLTVAEWSERLGIKRGTIFNRLNEGRPVAEVLHVGRLPQRKLSPAQGGNPPRDEQDP